MSGFAGILRLDGTPLDVSIDPVLDAMGAAVAHRGLAARRVLRHGPFGMVTCAEASAPQGGRRDETNGDAFVAFDGRIPLRHGSGGGETDNQSATRILARRYQEFGTGMVECLDGGFALALWDRSRGTLLLARDRVGVRPLFHAVLRDGEGGSLLLFGSEVKALLAHPDCPRDVDWLAALAVQAMPRRTFSRTSFFRGIESIAPGTVLLADTRTSSLRSKRYWKLEIPTAEEFAVDRRTDTEIIDGYRSVLETALEASLGDNPAAAGLMLSGGIDSVSLAALAARQVKLPTFTVLGQSTFGNGDAALAHRAASELGLPEHQVVFRWHEKMAPDQWRRILWLCETPNCGPQHYYKFQLHRHARDAYPDLTRMLNGEGSDELSGADFRNHGEDREGGTFQDYLDDLAFKQREQLQCVETLGVEEWMGRPVFTREFLSAASGRPVQAHPWHRRIAYVMDALESDVLWRDDRLSAGCGLQSEVPFLDHRLIEYVVRIPPRAYASLFLRKRMLREAMAGIVPEALRYAPKIPFYGGVDSRYTTRLLYDMLMADDQALVREAFGDGAHQVLASDLVDTVLEDCARDPQRGAVQVLLPLVNLGLLERMARDAAARPGPASSIPALPAISEWNETSIAELLAGKASAGPAVVPAFAPQVELVRPDGPHLNDPPAYLVVGDEVRYVLDADDTRLWREVLRRIDGKRPMSEILAELDVDFADVRKHFEEALEFEVLVVAAG